jgi:uncharacterized protein (DUF608 family)
MAWAEARAVVARAASPGGRSFFFFGCKERRVMEDIGITYPGEVNDKIGMAMGGLGTSTIEIDRAGRFQGLRCQNWWTDMRPRPIPACDFFSIHVRQGEKTCGKVMQLEHQHDLPLIKGLRYTGRFPFLTLDYEDDDLPCEVSLEAFSPFVPRDPDASSLPLVFFTFRIKNPTAERMHVATAFSWLNDIRIDIRGLPPQGNFNRISRDRKGVLMGTLFDELEDSQYLIAGVRNGDATFEVVADWWRVRPRRLIGPDWAESAAGDVFAYASDSEAALKDWDAFLKEGRLPAQREKYDGLGRYSYHQPVGAVAGRTDLEPGEEKEITFALVWYFPHHISGAASPHMSIPLGHQYAQRFRDGAEEVFAWAEPRFDDLRRRSGEWHRLVAESSLPPKTKALLVNTLYLAGRITWWLADGRFIFYESIDCPRMNCVVLEIYIAPAMAALFPDQHASAQKNVVPFQLDSGEIPTTLGLRGDIHCPEYRLFSAHDVGAYPLAVYWNIMWGGGGEGYLKEMYPVVKRLLKYGAYLDADGDGVPDIHGLDQGWDGYPMFGAAAYIADLRMAGLAVGEDLARRLGDGDFESWCREHRRRASETAENVLWNGEYYDLWYDPSTGKRSDTIFMEMFHGQMAASILGLGDLHPPERIEKSYDAVWKNNVKPCKVIGRSGARPDGSRDMSGAKPGQMSNSFSPAIILPLCSEAMRRGKYDASLELMERAASFVIDEVQEPWFGQVHFNADTGEHVYGKHYSDCLIYWNVLHSLTSATVNCLDRTMTLAPPRTPVKGPVMTKLFFGMVEFAQEDDAHVVALENFDETPANLATLTVRLPAGVAARRAAVEGEGRETVEPEEGAFRFKDVCVPAGGAVRIRFET